MKKVFIVFLLLSFGHLIVAQEIRFAVKGGLNVGAMRLVWDEYDIDDKGSKNGLYLGARAELGLSQRVSIQAEALYQSFGAEITSDFELSNQDVELEIEFTVTEVSIPIVVKLYVVPEKLSINGGVSAGYILKAQEKGSLEAPSISYYSDWDADMKDQELIQNINIGLSLGGEYRITDNIFADLRYNLGLMNLYVSDGGDIVLIPAVLQIGVGYRF